jgi:oligopeptide transport system ATP-binding protein
MSALLSLRDVSVSFPVKGGLFKPARQLKAVQDVSFDLAAGECLGVVGESGCGKSTLGRAILRFVDLAAGSITWKGQEIGALSEAAMAGLRSDIQVIFQNPLASLNPRMTVGDIIAEPLEQFRPEMTKAERQALARDWMEKVGLLPDMADRFPSAFSGGQAQRVAIARAMIAGPQVLICDEAVSALDVSVKAQIINLLRQLQRDTGVSLIFISHDLAVVQQISDHVLVMYLGKAMEIGPCHGVFSAPQHPYTKALISAIPVPDPAIERSRKPIILGTELPSPLSPPSGCVFRTRCPIAKPNCIAQVPELKPAASSQCACHFSGADLPVT